MRRRRTPSHPPKLRRDCRRWRQRLAMRNCVAASPLIAAAGVFVGLVTWSGPSPAVANPEPVSGGWGERHTQRDTAPAEPAPSGGQWVREDSNLRRRMPADLQSAPFGHLGTHPEGR